MPGIVGLITKRPRRDAESQLTRMLDTLRHGSRYLTGTCVDEASGVYVGWSVLKNSFADGMPIRNERGNLVLVFSGEEFCEPGTTARLIRNGHAFDANGPEYLVHLAEDNEDFPAILNGRFHGLLMDQARGTATLFNDRYGMHRVYYHESDDAVYFAAEAKAILAVRPELRRADPRGLGELLTCGCVMQDRTLFEGVRVLPAGSAWVFRNGAAATKGRYFRPETWEEQDTLGPNAYYDEIRRVFSRNLPRYLKAREPLAISLTGGLDTRMIMAWQKAPAGALPCYTFGGMFRECRDVTVARQVARECGQPHEVIEVGRDFLQRFGEYAERTVYLTDGCADVSRSPDLYVNERARDIAPVRLTGNYGGEVLRQVRAFKPVPPEPDLFHPELLPHVRQAVNTYADVTRGHPLSFAVFRQAPWHHYGLLALEQTELTLRSPYLDNDFVRTVFRAPAQTAASNDTCLRLIADGDDALADIRTDRGRAGNTGGLRAAALRGLLEFEVKAEYAYDYGMPQWVAAIDHAFAPLHLERLFLGRHKFYHFRVWYRDALSAHIREVLLDRRTLSRPYLSGSTLEAMVNAHLRGERNFTTAIHKVLTLEYVHRLFIDHQ